MGRGSFPVKAPAGVTAPRPGPPYVPTCESLPVEEIWINEPSKVFIARHGRSELTTTIFTATEIRDLVERMLKSSGRRIDLSYLLT
jgi:pilus assembly protein CpaF